jgi:hypothetical protein
MDFVLGIAIFLFVVLIGIFWKEIIELIFHKKDRNKK